MLTPEQIVNAQKSHEALADRLEQYGIPLDEIPAAFNYWFGDAVPAFLTHIADQHALLQRCYAEMRANADCYPECCASCPAGSFDVHKHKACDLRALLLELEAAGCSLPAAPGAERHDTSISTES